MNDFTNKVIEVPNKNLYCYKQGVINGDIYLILVEIIDGKLNYENSSIYQYMENESENTLKSVNDEKIIKMMISFIE